MSKLNKISIFSIVLLLFTACSVQENVEVGEVDSEFEVGKESEGRVLEQQEDRQELFKFIVLGDSHGDIEEYPLLLEQIKGEDPDFLVHVGDLSKVGGYAELQQAKQLLDAVGINYYTLPGDHDIVDSGSVEIFESFFGSADSFFAYEGFRFILFDNSDTTANISQQRWDWLSGAVDTDDPVILFLHNPPEHPLLTPHTMQQEEEGARDASKLRGIVSNAQIERVFVGEMHMYMNYILWDTIPLTAVGAAGQYSNPGLPQYVLVIVYNTGESEVQQKVLIK